ncbi:MAG: MgtC/SapB family protein [Chitinophagaceae bacterium]|nr:MAG: MgtC/SapB family protein [Chitinophagaceae bacterium]
MLTTNEILIRLSLACLFGGLIGLERERKHWAAGLRTHMLVCLGASLIMIVSAFGFSDIINTNHIALDPSRIAAQVVSGIGFIGAGAILFSKQGTVRGLTTAAGLWTVAGIGLATGGGLYYAAAAATLIVLIILWGLQPLEKIYFKKFRDLTLRIITDVNANNNELLKNILSKDKLKVQTFTLEKKENDFIFQIKLESMDISKMDILVTELKSDMAIKEINWSLE